MWYVYLLLCNGRVFYVGITKNLAKRLREHKNRLSFFTKQFSEIELVYCERYKLKHEAARREKQLKGWSRAKKRKLIDGELGINTCTEFAKVLVGRES